MNINTSSNGPDTREGTQHSKIGFNLGQKIKGILSSKNKEFIEESPTLQALKEFIGENPTWTLPKEIRKKFKGNQSGIRTKIIDQGFLGGGKEVDYIAEKNSRGGDVYKEIVDESMIEEKYQQFLSFMNTRLGTDNRDERIKKEGKIDRETRKSNIITIPEEKVEELYSSLERLGFPKGNTDNYGNIQSTNNFNIRIFRPDGSSLNMIVSKNEVKFNFYDKNAGYVAIGLPNNSKK